MIEMGVPIITILHNSLMVLKGFSYKMLIFLKIMSPMRVNGTYIGERYRISGEIPRSVFNKWIWLAYAKKVAMDIKISKVMYLFSSVEKLIFLNRTRIVPRTIITKKTGMSVNIATFPVAG